MTRPSLTATALSQDELAELLLRKLRTTEKQFIKTYRRTGKAPGICMEPDCHAVNMYCASKAPYVSDCYRCGGRATVRSGWMLLDVTP